MHAAVLPDPRGPIEEVDLDRLGEPNFFLLAGRDRARQVLRGPRQPFILEEILRELERCLDADAAVAERANPAREERVVLSAVQVYREAVREHELHAAQGIVRSGTLRKTVREVGLGEREPVDLLG